MPLPINQSGLLEARLARRIIHLIAATIILFLIWASLSPLDEIIRGQGKVVPSSRAQVIQSLEGGIVEEIHVWEGKEVEKGDILARLSDTKFDGSVRELESDVIALEARLIRLENELQFAQTLSLPDHIRAKDPEIAKSEIQFFNARLHEYMSSHEALENAVTLSTKEVAMLEKMARKKIVPELDLVTARQAQNEAIAALKSLESEYQLVRSEDYATTLTELKKFRALMDIRKDQLQRTVLTAPVRGVVNDIRITTIGGVAPPGEPILELTPLGDDLRIEAQIAPEDVAFIRPGLPATIKLSAYDYTVYGSLTGEIIHISADTFEESQFSDKPPYYKALISVSANTLSKAQSAITIRPGMIAETELHTGQKTVLQYLLKPLFKAKEAFREP